MKNNILKIFAAFLGVMLVGCLDDDKYALDPSGTQNIIEFLDPSVPASPAGAVYPAYASSFVFSPEDEFEVVISYSGPNDNSRDIDLTLAVDPVALDEYNTQMVHGLNGAEGLHGTTYSLMPESNYSIETMTATIPKGQTKVTLPITVFPDQFDFSKNYAIPLRIVTASHGTLSAHFSVAILAIGVRNIYDGIYEITGGSITRNSANGPDQALGGDYVDGIELELVTLASNKLAFAPVWKDGSGVGGIDATSITINEATNEITVASAKNASLRHIVGSVNSYDPATKEFTVNIEWGTPPSDRIIKNLKLTYVGPRP